jgi:hypothetical protein
MKLGFVCAPGPWAAESSCRGLRAAFAVRRVTVSNSNDAGAGSLRQAILDSNATPGVYDSIAIDIAPGADRTVELLTPLPTITDPVEIGDSPTGVSPTTPQLELIGAG